MFLTTDTTTLGNWKGVYGSDGFNVINDTTHYPAYAIVTPAGNNSWTWADPTSDVRALQHASGSNRLAATWYGSTYTIDINITDGQTHRLALYIVDWEPFGRTQRFDVRDASTNALLDTRTASAFTGGQYLVWTVQGHVTIQVTQVGGGGGAVVSGVFFGQ